MTTTSLVVVLRDDNDNILDFLDEGGNKLSLSNMIADAGNPKGLVVPGIPQLFRVNEGMSLTMSVDSGGIGKYEEINIKTQATLKTVNLASNQKTTTTAQKGIHYYLVTCTAGSINVSVEDAVLGSPQSASLGGNNAIVLSNGMVVPLSGTPKFVKGKVLKRFTDLRNVTLSNGTSMTSVATIDQNSPYGGPAMKLVLTAAAGGIRTHDVILSNMKIAKFGGRNENIGIEVWIDDPLKITQFTTYIGNANLALYNQYNRTVAQGGDKVGEDRVIEVGSVRTPTVNTFTFGVDTLEQVKFRTSVTGGQTVTLWVREIAVSEPQSPIICFTGDDDFSVWIPRCLPHLARNNIKATFGINTADIVANTGGTHLTAADVKTIVAAGHQVSSHGVNNYKLRTLEASGNGENNGSGTAQDAVPYTNDIVTAAGTLTSTCEVPSSHMCYYPWVQGGADTVGVAYARAEGIEIARNIGAPSEVNLYGFEMGNNAMYLKAVELGSGTTLAQAKAAVDKAVACGGLLVFMFHNFADTALNSVTWAESDWSELCDYVGGLQSQRILETMRMMDLRDRLRALGLLRRQPSAVQAVRQIGSRLAVNFNSTGDTQIFLDLGNFVVTEIAFTKTTLSMTTATGGVYSAATKGGTPIIPAATAYTTLVAATDVVIVPVDAGAAALTVTGSIYLSLTTAQGAAATVDVFVFGRPV